eukprot:TRINITY_DN2468_c0_g1_i1.p1 TRINITY_DN2468_c0_g1~~TRINITY_DN2468_c0_g1_i1.p1  ORF type:complete len:140 (+),score=11.71 TRINITY_DN2468_c0_g1_i1:295-714(+)
MQAQPIQMLPTTRALSQSNPCSSSYKQSSRKARSCRYDVKYKQAVTSEDMYLGMSNRNPSSASCEDIVIEVKLPQTAYREVVLDVNDRVLDVACPKYRLYLPLPHPVNSKQGAAQWLAKQEILRITLPLNRELEFIYRA